MRIALLTEIPAPFRIPLFNALAGLDGIDLQVLFLSRNDPRRNYPVYESEFRFEWQVLPGRDLSARGRWIVLNAGVRGRVRRSRPRTPAFRTIQRPPAEMSRPGSTSQSNLNSDSYTG